MAQEKIYLITSQCSLKNIFFDKQVLQKADRLLLACRVEKNENSWQLMSPGSDKAVRHKLKPFLLDSFIAKEWPGTQMLTNTQGARVYILEYNSEVANLVLGIESELFNWINYGKPALPEDICLFKQGTKYPIFFSVTHEKMAWYIGDSPPECKGKNIEINTSDSMGLISGDEYFCKRH